MFIKQLLIAGKGEPIDRFADEVIRYCQAIQTDVVAVFNEIYIEVKPTMTEKEFMHQYWRSRQ